MSRKLRVGVVFGGRSGEHEVSLRSAASIMAALNPAAYDVVPIGIDRQGEWIFAGDPMQALTNGAPTDAPAHALALSEKDGVLALREDSGTGSVGPLDVVFPVLHGPYGEDGTVQGLLEMAGIPYVGSGVLGSAVGMDKPTMKALFLQAGLPVAPHTLVLRSHWIDHREAVAKDAAERYGYPMFVKPGNLGSSVGVSKVHNQSEFAPAMDLACEYDRRILVEKSIENAREIECSVLGNDFPEASVCGEIIPAGEFYDYDSKYFDKRSRTVIPADLPDVLHERIRQMAVIAFKTLDCAGMARIDFLVRRDDDAIFMLEANTIPGFTEISMYSKLWEATGLTYRSLLDRLIQLGIERHRERARMRVTR